MSAGRHAWGSPARPARSHAHHQSARSAGAARCCRRHGCGCGQRNWCPACGRGRRCGRRRCPVWRRCRSHGCRTRCRHGSRASPTTLSYAPRSSPPHLRRPLHTTQQRPTPTSPPPLSLPGPLLRRAWYAYVRPPSPGSTSEMRPMPARSPTRSTSSASVPQPRSGPRPLDRPIPACPAAVLWHDPADPLVT